MSEESEIATYILSLKVIELKDELKKRHLPYVGNKQALAQRLREDMVKELEQTDEVKGEDPTQEIEEPVRIEASSYRQAKVLLLAVQQLRVRLGCRVSDVDLTKPNFCFTLEQG